MKRFNSLVCVTLAVSGFTVASTTAAGGAPGRAQQVPVGKAVAQAPMKPAVCYAPGTSREVIRANARQQRDLISSLQSEGFQFSDGSRWSTTATNGSGLTQGQVTTITWNIVPDGTPIGALGGIAGESTAASDLRAFLDGIYGNEATWIAHFQTVFDQWGALTGVNYVKVNYDDSIALSTAAGVIGTRADVRIGGHLIDGNFNVLAYNFFPSNGDMVIDTGDSYYSTSGLSNGSLGFRNMLAHEHGHGLGLSHSCPGNGTKLMEPSLSTAFTHAQHDDKLAGWRGYGDDKENNETSATASSLGSLGLGTVTLTELSADDDSDVDFYSFTVTAGKRAAVTMTPTGSTYLAGPQNGDGSCSAGTSFNALAINDLGVELRSTDGTTVLASSNTGAAGVTESIGGTSLPGAGTYFVRVSAGAINSVQGYNLAVTITDNTGSFVAIDDVAVTEGNSGTSNATFTLTRSGTLTGTVSVSVQTAANTALAPSDFTATGPTTLTFGPGVTSQNFSVPVVGDTFDEPNETFFVNLSSPSSGLTIEDTQGVGTINDNDNAPTISINDVSLAEGNSGSTNATFTASLSAASGQTVTVDYTTADGTAAAGGLTQSNATAIAIPSSLGNATPYPSQITVSGASGTITKAVVTLNGFTHSWPRDTDVLLIGPAGHKIILMSDVGGVNTTPASNVTLTLDATSGTLLPTGQLSTGTYAPRDNSDGEGADTWSGTTGPYDSTLTLLNGTTPNGTWSLYVSDDTAGDSGSFAGGWTLSLTTSGGDYTPASGTLTYAPGETTKTITVPVIGDAVAESNETFFVNLSGAANATISDSQGQGTITNDDGGTPTVSINDITVTEGNAGTTTATFTVSLSASSASTVTVSAATANNTAVAPGDYTAVGATTLTFNPGVTTQTFAVTVQSDLLDETNETYFVNLSSATNATISDNQGQGTITDDDATPSLSINDVTVTEGNAGTTTATFTATLSAASGQTVTVSAATANNTAVAPGDYTAVGATTVTFNPGVTTQTFAVTVQSDLLDETNETYFVNLSSATNATISDNQGVGTITDDDATAPTVTTGAATSVGQSGATLNGTVNPNGAATDGRFEYGTTLSYGTTTGNVAIGSGSSPVAVSFAATGLACNTLYHFRAVGENSGGTTNGGDLTFTTAACPVGNNNISALTAQTIVLNSTSKDSMSSVRTEIWFRVRLFASRSYQISAWPVDHEQAVDAPTLSLSLFSDNAGTMAASPAPVASSATLEGSPNNNGDALPTSLLFQPTVSGTYKIRILRTSGGAVSHSMNLAVRETTLFSPWTSRAAGFEGFIEMHNNTDAPVNVTLRGFDSTGAQQGAGLTITLQPNATDFRTASQAGVPVDIFAGIVLTHDGALGAVSANITTLNGANGLSFDSPFTLRNQAGLGPPVR